MKKLKPVLLSAMTLATSLTSFGQVGSGWQLINWANPGLPPIEGRRSIHLEDNGDKDYKPWTDRTATYYFKGIDGSSTVKGTYSHNKATATEVFTHYGPRSRSVNRAEIRILDDYGTGEARQFEAYVTLNEKLSEDQAFFQIWGYKEVNGATYLQLRLDPGTGYIVRQGGAPIRNDDMPNEDVRNKEFKLNVIHIQEKARNGNTVTSPGRLQIYVNGRQYASVQDTWVTEERTGSGGNIAQSDNYFKYGVYGTVDAGRGDAKGTFKNARYFKSGSIPGTNPQTITFPALPSIPLNGGDVTPRAISTSNLPVTYRSDNHEIAVITEEGKIRPVKAGKAKIWASQDGNSAYAPALVQIQEITVTPGGTVTKKPQSITFNVLPAKQVSDRTFNLDAKSDSGLTVTYASSDTSVATIENNIVTILKAGKTFITASQAGDSTYLAATPVTRELIVNASNVAVTGVSILPTSLSLAVGTQGELKAAVIPSTATNQSVIWSSSGAAATVSNTGIVTAVSPGTAVITVRTVDGAFAATSTVTVTSSTTPPSGATPITAPFVKEGLGSFYWVVSAIPGQYFEFNSWQLSKLEINGVDLTGKWSTTKPGDTGSAPPAINGKYYIRYTGSFAWSHFDIKVVNP